ncbi:MAG: N-methyl-L-tryptophan oxidase [Microbacteriaceae bacterium]
MAIGHYDHIVIGAGAIGTATAYWLSRRTSGRVLVLEQHRLGHDRGASQDHSRIIRHVYHSTAYTRLTGASYAAWRHVEAESGVPLITTTGGLSVADGEAADFMVLVYSDALGTAGIPFDVLEADELRARYPQWHVGDDARAIYQAESGILDIAKAHAVHTTLARKGGVEFLEECRVEALHPSDTGVEVVTSAGVFTAGQVSICVASWTNDLVDPLGVRLPLRLTHEQVTYWRTPNLAEYAPERFPVWIYHSAAATYYGFPVYGEVATKAGRDVTNLEVTQATRTFRPDAGLRDELEAFMGRYLPGALGPELYTKPCIYDLPPDRDFVIDTLPGIDRISVFVGAGHAGKFASLMGSVMADLAVDGGTVHPIEPFSMRRPQIADPGYRPRTMYEYAEDYLRDRAAQQA